MWIFISEAIDTYFADLQGTLDELCPKLDETSFLGENQ